MTIRKAVPVGLRAAAERTPKHAEALEAAAVRCEHEGTREACKEAKRIADAAYAAAAAYAAGYAADADAAYVAAADAADADADADAARTRDRVLAQYAEWVVEILIDMQAPGCQWLTLAPMEVA